jgi:phospholipid/cholesterol/gamma-HCH transport system substrate-binding protein
MGARIRVAALGTIAIAAVLIVLLPKYVGGYRLELRTYFNNAEGLKPGAPVRVAGVDVGRVLSVRARPDLRDHAAEVVMDIHTVYELRIPNDAVAVVNTNGVAGESLVNIEVANAYGSPLSNGGVVKAKDVPQLTMEDYVRLFQQLAHPQPQPK